MNNDETPAQPPPPRSGGCLKLTCGVILGLMVLGAILFLVLWYFLTRWGKGESAWEHLPPSAVAAVELYDVRGLLEHALRDPAIVSQLRPHMKWVERQLAASPDFQYTPSPDGEELLEYYRSLGFLHTTLLPNIGIIGMTDDDEVFAIAKMPPWSRWSIGKAESGRSIPLDNGFQVIFIESWVALSTSEAVLQEISDNWSAGAKPLGPAFAADAPHVAAAGFWPGKGAGAGAPAAPPPGTPMMLGNPFAAPPGAAGGGAVGAGDAAERAGRVLLKPGGKGWEVVGGAGQFAGRNEVLAFFSGLERDGFRGSGLSVPKPEGNDLAASASIAPELYERYVEWLRGRAGSRAGGQAGNGANALLDAWLGKAKGDFLVFAGEPAVNDPDLAPLPVVTVGWPLAPGQDPRAAADGFGRAVENLLAIKAPGGERPLVSAVRESVKIEPLAVAGGEGGVVDLPPVMLNAARPAWVFLGKGGEGSGWLSTDPAGLAGVSKLTGAFGGTTAGAPALRVSAEWDLSLGFRAAALETVRDRVEMLPDDVLASKDVVLDVCAMLERLFASYPRGAFEASGDPETEGVRFRLTIPEGVRTDH